MPSTALTPVAAAAAGINPGMVAVDAVNGNSFPNQRQNQLVIISNSDGSPHTVTAVAQQTAVAGGPVFPPLTNPNIALAVPAGGTRILGPLPASFVDTAGNSQLTWSAATGMTVGVVTLP
jgi:hypothetical protein